MCFTPTWHSLGSDSWVHVAPSCPLNDSANERDASRVYQAEALPRNRFERISVLSHLRQPPNHPKRNTLSKADSFKTRSLNCSRDPLRDRSESGVERHTCSARAVLGEGPGLCPASRSAAAEFLSESNQGCLWSGARGPSGGAGGTRGQPPVRRTIQ